MRSIAQNRFTAVGRVPASRAQMRLELRAQSPRRVGGIAADRAERHSVGGGNTDGRRAANHHGDDHVRHLFIVGGEHIAFLEREPGLVEEANPLGGPCQGRNHSLQFYLLTSPVSPPR